ncbi:MAG: toprim domain-containing protein, partial [Chloroflexi bacterium]|nr:toprim domain-containing protein [Chloroflexota bacterium]
DVIQAHQAGFSNVIAQMGTALTETQLRTLGRYAKALILALDPDTAGQTATQRGREVIERVSQAAAEQALQEGVWAFDQAEETYHARLTAEFDAQGMLRYEGKLGFDIRVITLPDGQDPDDVIRESPEQWVALVENAQTIVEYMIDAATMDQDLEDPKVKAAIARSIVPLIEGVADPVERSHYRQYLARVLRVAEQSLFASYGAETRKPTPRTKEPEASTTTVDPSERLATEDFVYDGGLVSETFCLTALIHYPRLVYRANRVLDECVGTGVALDDDVLVGRLSPDDFTSAEHREIFRHWQDALNQKDMEPLVYLAQMLAPSSWTSVQGWLADSIDRLLRESSPATRRNLTDDVIQDEAVQRLIDLRISRIKQVVSELAYALNDDDSPQGRAFAAGMVSALRNLELARGQQTVRGRRQSMAKSYSDLSREE